MSRVSIEEAGNGSKLLPFSGLSIQPNLFNPTTTIRFQGSGQSKIRIYDLNGRIIRNWFGMHLVIWNGKDLHGKEAASGTYIVGVSVGERVISRRIGLMRYNIAGQDMEAHGDSSSPATKKFAEDTRNF